MTPIAKYILILKKQFIERLLFPQLFNEKPEKHISSESASQIQPNKEDTKTMLDLGVALSKDVFV